MNLLAMQKRFAADLCNGAMAYSAGMRVYAHAYRAQLIACLQDTYEKTRAWLGDDAFDAAAQAYVETHPPSEWTLDAYGASFGDHLDVLCPADAEVAELAWLDWHLRRAFAGADAAPVSASTLAGADWDRASLLFVPTLRFRTTHTHAAALWRAIDDDVTSMLVGTTAQTGAVRVWRQGMATRFSSMSAMEASYLDLAVAGASFGEICDYLARDVGNDQALTEAGALLRCWLEDGLVSGLA